MTRTSPVLVLNLSDLATKRNLMAKISTLSGLYEVTLKPRKLTRTLSQNSYYFAAVVTLFTEWLKEQWGDPGIRPEQAHEALKRKILGTKEFVNKATGEVLEVTPTSHDLDTFEFGQYVDNAAAWLAEFANIVVLPSEMFVETKAKRTLEDDLKDSIEMIKKSSSGAA